MNFRLIRSGIMIPRPGATYSIAAVFAGIFPEASRGPCEQQHFAIVQDAVLAPN
jgi:hypothetical protein